MEASEPRPAAAALDEGLEADEPLEDHHPESPSLPSPESHLEALEGPATRESDSLGCDQGRLAADPVMLELTKELGIESLEGDPPESVG